MGRIKQTIKNILPYAIAKKYLEQPVNISLSDYPRLYNEYGEEMLFMYLQNSLGAHIPYCLTSGRIPRRIVYDRYNHALRHQMYCHLKMLNRMPRKDETRQYGIMVESEIICPDEYDTILNKEQEVRSLDALFTFSERLLDKYENAKFSIGNGVWYGTKLYGGVIDPERYNKKRKLISAVASAKKMCPIHIFRAENARELKRRGLADTMGTAVGEYFEKISDAFDDYMYNISIENESQKYYFTEKILDCFASMTVPVYYGATEIGKFFNEDGIIRIKEPTIECVLKTIGQCSEQDYNSRAEAIKDNFERVQKYLSVDDYLTWNYGSLFFD